MEIKEEVKTHWFMGDRYEEVSPRKSGTCEGCHFHVPSEICFTHIWVNGTQVVCGVRDVVFKKL